MARRSTGHLLILAALTILLTGCENFTLIGNINLGGEEAPELAIDAEVDASDPENGGDSDVCWPSGSSAVAEMRRHGYTKETWTETAKWFTALESLKTGLPPCE